MFSLAFWIFLSLLPQYLINAAIVMKRKEKKMVFFSNTQKAWFTLHIKVEGLYYFVPQYCSDLFLKAFNQ